MAAKTIIAYLLILLMAIVLAGALWHFTRDQRAFGRARRRRRRARRNEWSKAEAEPDSIGVYVPDQAPRPPGN